MSIENIVINIYRHASKIILRSPVREDLSTYHNFKELEKGIKELPVGVGKWISIDDIIQHFTVAIGNNDPVSFQKIGRQWKYVLPTYSSEEITFIKGAILENLAESYIVECGKYDQKELLSNYTIWKKYNRFRIKLSYTD